MLKFLKIVRIAAVALCFIYALGYVFLLVRGKQIIVAKLQQYTGGQAKVGMVILRFPFTFEVKDLSVAGQFTAKALRLRPSVLGLVTNKVLLYNITFIEPAFVYNRASAKSSGIVRSISDQAKGQAGTPRTSSTDFLFRRLSIVNGTLIVIDTEVNKDSGGLKVTCEQLNLELVNAYEFPDSIITRFKLDASVPWEKSEAKGSVSAQGWVDLYQKDMQAVLTIKDIDGVYLQPYFSSWLDLSKTGIEKAKLNFTSDISGLRNQVTAVSRLELAAVEFRQKDPEEEKSREEKIAQVVLGILKGIDQGNIVLNFTLKTTMDDPEFGVGPVRAALEDKITLARRNRGLNVDNVILFPGRVITGTVQSVAGASKSLLESLFGVGKELGKSVGGSFSRQENTTAVP